MYYCITTNRPERFEFAYEQFKKFPKGTKLIVLDNTPNGMSKWKLTADVYFHIPHCENVSQMFNHMVDNWTEPFDHFFYQDDDIEISESCHDIMMTWINEGYERVCPTKLFVTDTSTNETGVWYRHEINCGSPWMISGNLFKATCEMTVKGRKPRYHPDLKDGYVFYFRDLPSHNCKFVFDDICNALIHGTNNTMKRRDNMCFEFNLERVYL